LILLPVGVIHEARDDGLIELIGVASVGVVHEAGDDDLIELPGLASGWCHT
jgi:hypothetical protein